MNTDTPTTQNLAEALALFQADMPVIEKSRTGQAGNRTFRYADIADITRACSPLLASLGLSVTGGTQIRDGRTILVMKLKHTSGDVEPAELDVTAPHGDMKAMGANLTYARRYLYGILTGVVTDEDTDREGTNVTKPEKKELPQSAKADQEYLYDAARRQIPVDKIMAKVISPSARAEDLTPDQLHRLRLAVQASEQASRQEDQSDPRGE